ncbi:hypothetical protein Tamer19_11810 [Cupriavidus sp. TA19]|nr:hypothetical protein Tamer19_11810 [Cupriavidus sp. TA19]
MIIRKDDPNIAPHIGTSSGPSKHMRPAWRVCTEMEEPAGSGLW